MLRSTANYQSWQACVNFHIKKESLISSIERRKKLLSNEGYVKNAPEKIVNSEREKLKDEENKLKALEEKLN